MHNELYGIFDTVAREYIGQTKFFLYRHHAPAVRIFTDLISDPSTPLNKHPEDYELHSLGIFKDDNKLTAHEFPEVITTGKAIKSILGMDSDKEQADTPQEQQLNQMANLRRR